jgi:hypothetical protein
MNKDKLKSLTYGIPTSSMFDTMSEATPLIEISPDSVDVSAHPSNDGGRTKSEMLLVKRAMKDLKPGEETFVNLSDKRMLDLFKSEAVREEVYFDEDYFEDLKSQLSGFILNIKFRFNRPRPVQIAEMMNIEFPALDTNTVGSPSYPSGHTIQAMVMANALGSLYPNLRDKFRNLAERIGMSRVQAGVHFPSDVDAGIKIADAIEPYVLLPGEVTGDRREHDLRSIARNFISDLDFPG